jgi:hypothetical protein
VRSRCLLHYVDNKNVIEKTVSIMTVYMSTTCIQRILYLFHSFVKIYKIVNWYLFIYVHVLNDGQVCYQIHKNKTVYTGLHIFFRHSNIMAPKNIVILY